MEQSALQKFMAEYAEKIKAGTATVKDHSSIKNALRDTYDAGNINKESMSDLGKKATHSYKNMFAAKDHKSMAPKILEKGGTVGKFDEAYKPTLGKVVRSAKDAGKKVRSFGPLLGMLGAGAAAMGVGQKAMAGDYKGAAGDTVDVGTDLIPGASQVKQIGRGLASGDLKTAALDTLDAVTDFTPLAGPKYIAKSLAPTDLGAEPTDPVSMKGSLFEEEYKQDANKKFNNLKNKLAGK